MMPEKKNKTDLFLTIKIRQVLSLFSLENRMPAAGISLKPVTSSSVFKRLAENATFYLVAT